MTTGQDRKPWERLDSETPRAYEAFRVYRSLTPEKRSLEAVAERARRKQGKGKASARWTPGYITEWSATHRWVERAAAYDDHLDEVRRQASERAIAEMSRKHAEGMRKIFDRGLKRIEDLPDADIKGGLALELAVQGMRGERLARGLTTDNVRQEVQGDLNVKRDDGLADRILADPEATDIACRLLEQVSARESDAGRVRDGGVKGPVETGEAPEPP